MRRIQRLFRDMWWLMLLVAALAISLGYYVSPFFLVYLPMAAGFFTYFAMVRYDAAGNDRQT